jgi:(p)ppGpp synthase/HD superfamily hydrolase
MLNQLDEAIVLATSAHAGQVDLVGHPIILHVLRVAAGPDLDDYERIVAVLHDTIEDTTVDWAQLERAFGCRVADDVQMLARDPDDDYIHDYIKRIAERGSIAAIKVKLADLADNLHLRRSKVATEADAARNARYRRAQTILRYALNNLKRAA